jgi:polyisoprenoid-binding protein YceI
MKRLRDLISCCLLLAAASLAQSVPIDTQRSSMIVKVAKAGVFSAFGHNHEIRAPIASGSIDTSGSGSVRLKVDARAMVVLDEDLEADKRVEVQRRMEGAEVLDTARFPEIEFVSHKVEASGEDAYRVTGDLTLHGVTRPVVVNVKKQNGRYVGTATVKQTEFGIKPVTAGGGTVKVKDPVEVEFQIATEMAAK